MAGSTWIWNGSSASGTDRSQWTLSAGPGNPSGTPEAGDTAIVTSGTVIAPLNTQVNDITLDVGGLGGVPAALLFSGNSNTGLATPTLNAAAVVQSAVPGHTGPETTVLNADGTFVNDGSILADGSAGSIFEINIGATTVGTVLAPGYFFNPNLIQADAGNTLIINVGSESSIFNSSSIVADGGTVVVNADPAAIAGGVAGLAAFWVVEGGGTLETEASYPFLPGTTTQPNGTSPRYVFGDTSAGNTIKIENLGSFGGAFVGFQAGDTVDVGASLAVNAIAYNAPLGILELLNAGGAVLGSLYLNTNGMVTSGTFVLNNGTADGIIVGTGADGDTILTTNRIFPTVTASGLWQNSTIWTSGIVPTGTDSAFIGLNQTNPITITTGAAPVVVAGITVFDPHATLDITSNTTTLPGGATVYEGTLDVAGGATLTTARLRTFSPGSAVDIAAGGTVMVTGRPNSSLAASGGTITLSQGNSAAVGIYAGTLTVDGALIAGPSPDGNGGSFLIGFESGGTPATVIVNSGGTVTDTYSLLGSDVTSSGTMILDGAGASWTDAIDPNDPLNSRGYVVVGDNSLSGNIGTLAPVAPALLVIENGATMTDQVAGHIGEVQNSSGLVVVQDGGLWNLADNGVGYLDVGLAGSGTLAVLSGGRVDVGNLGTFLSNGTALVAGGIGIGQSITSSGTVLVSGAGSKLSTSYGVTVGRRGAGLLSILNGGTVQIAAGGIEVGQSPDAASSGTIVVGGPGGSALLTVGTAASIFSVGFGSTGTLIVADHGTVTSNAFGGPIVAGDSAGSRGQIDVQGVSSAAVINATNRGLVVARSGIGVMDVSGLGAVNLIGTTGLTVGQSIGAVGLLSIVNGGHFLDLAGYAAGQLAGSVGTMVVAGEGAYFENNNTSAPSSALSVGLAGTGELLVGSGGTVLTHNGIVVAANIGSQGTVVVAGTGASLTDIDAANGIEIGVGAAGTLAIVSGTVSSNGILGLGINNGGTGLVTLSGAGANLNAAGIEVGASGAGTLLAAGAAITAGAVGVGGSTSAPLSSSHNLLSLTSFAYLVDSSSLAVWNGSTVSLDSGSVMDVGLSGGFIGGAIDVGNAGSIIGNGLVAAAVVNNALIEASSATAPNAFNAGTLEITGNIAGSGAIGIAANAIFRADGAVSAGQEINFGLGGGSELILGDPTGGGFGNQITGLATGDRILFGNGFTITSASVVNGNTIAIDYHGSGGVAGTYDLTNVGFAPGTNENLSWGTDFNSGLAYIQLQPLVFNWQGGFGTNYGTPNNWQGGTVPNATETANFVNNPGTVTGTGSALSLNIGNYNGFKSGTWTFAGAKLTVAGSPSAPYLPFAIGFYADTVLNGGTLNAAGGDTNIGNSNGVTVTAEGGAQVTTLGDSVATNSGQTGTLVVTGVGTKWTEVAGAPVNGDRPGFLNVGGNGPSGNASGSAGYLIITNGAWVNTEGNAEVGGFGIGAYGAATLSAGALWTVGDLQVGPSGEGIVTVESGGTLLFGGTYNPVGGNAGSSGTLLINSGGTVASTSTLVGGPVMEIGANGGGQDAAAADGTVVVSGVGALLNLNGNPLNVGNNGNGGLTVAQGGTVLVGAGTGGTALNAGFNPGSDGTILVEGTRSALDIAGYAGLGVGGSATLTVDNNADMVVSNLGTTSSGSINLGVGNPSYGATGGEGDANITSGGSLSVQAGITVGGNGADGTLNVNGGGTVLIGTGLTVGIATEVNGTVYGGTGVVNIGAGGTVQITAASQDVSNLVQIGADNSSVGGGPTNLAEGDVTVTGAGALLDTNNNPIAIGQSGIGNLTVSQHGTVLVGVSNSVAAAVGVGRLGTGNLTVTDQGSEFVSDGFVFVGRAGTGSLVIENHARMVVNYDSAGYSGALAIGAANGTANSTQTTVQTGGAGYADVTSDGDLYAAQNVSVGEYGVTGALAVNTGGTVEAAHAITIGLSETLGAGGTLVTASGTTVVTEATLLAGQGVIDVGAGGLLKADGSGITSVGASDILVGDGVGATGALNVTGAGATVNSGGYRIGIGAAGQGSLLISQGGTVLAGTPYASDEAIYAGGSVGATGAVTITDPGSKLIATGQLLVGSSGQGSLLIENQGTAVTGNNPVDATEGFDVALNASAAGDATVTGTRSLLSNTGRFVVGDAGTGSLSIEAGGSVITTPGTSGLPGAVIAAQVSASGSSVDVTGAGSDWQIGGALDVGSGGTGLLAVTNGASVTAATIDAGVSAGSAGTITVSGPNSDLTASGSVSIGDAGSGEFSILDGANANIDGDLNIANAGTGSGKLDIEDTTGTIYFGGNINVGFNGIGVLTIGPNVTYRQDYGGVNAGLNATVTIDSLADPSPYLNNSSPNYQFNVNGTAAYAAYVGNTGNIIIGAGHTLVLQTPTIYGAGGTFTLNSGAGLTVDADGVSGQTFSLAGGNLLQIGYDALDTIKLPASGTGPFDPPSPNPNEGELTIGGFDSTIAGYTAGDTIVVDTYAAATFSRNGAVVSVIENATTLGVLAFDTAANAQAALAADAVVDRVLCFAAGTLIETRNGPRPVESLRESDQVRTLLGGGSMPVVWLGQRAVDCARHPRPEKVWPVRVAVGAFGAGQPARALYLSPDHAVHVNDVLIPVRYLINGTSIRQEKRETVTYYHVELDRHEVIVAEGLAVESYLDTGDRAAFANGGGLMMLHPEFGTGPGDVWEMAGCAPVVVTGPVLEAAREKVAARQTRTDDQGMAPMPALPEIGLRATAYCLG
jgi:T5SS/PEP-CTERM-associated repeat protein